MASTSGSPRACTPSRSSCTRSKASARDAPPRWRGSTSWSPPPTSTRAGGSKSASRSTISTPRSSRSSRPNARRRSKPPTRRRRRRSRALGERDSEIMAHQQTVRSGELREQLWEQKTASLRDTQKKLQLDLAEARERIAQLDADKASADERIAAATKANENLGELTRVL